MLSACPLLIKLLIISFILPFSIDYHKQQGINPNLAKPTSPDKKRKVQFEDKEQEKQLTSTPLQSKESSTSSSNSDAVKDPTADHVTPAPVLRRSSSNTSSTPSTDEEDENFSDLNESEDQSSSIDLGSEDTDDEKGLFDSSFDTTEVEEEDELEVEFLEDENKDNKQAELAVSFSKMTTKASKKVVALLNFQTLYTATRIRIVTSSQ